MIEPRVLLTGASGFIGSALSCFLKKKGYHVVHLKRGEGVSSDDEIFWDPLRPFENLSDFEGFEAVIHLAGSGIADHRWSAAYKKQLYTSRIQYTKALVSLLLRTQRPARLFLSASGVGYYGNRADEVLTETSGAGSGFLATLCKEWESVSLPLEKKGIRVIHARFGVVLDPSGGMLKKMLPLYRWGLGAKLGRADQFVSWISLSELLRAVAFCLSTPSIKGAVNFTSPSPIRQAEFAQILANSVHRSVFLTLPASVLRYFLNEMADELLLSSQRALPEKLTRAGFVFKSSFLEQVLG